MKVEILDEWARHNEIPDLMIWRKTFYVNNPRSRCTCDKCAAVTICSLAYDEYNTNGDCLYDK